MKIIFAILFLMSSLGLFAQNMPITLPSVISDHAVFQQSSEIKLWGWGPSTKNVAIVGSWEPLDTMKVLVTDECTWKATIKTPKAGGPYTVQFLNGTNKVTISDILIGEVWLCSGQSNMALSCNANILDAGDALKAPRNNDIRFFQVKYTHDIYPHSDCSGKWVVCDSTTIKQFSAVGYFFGSTLQKKMNVPVGLISSCMGATRIQPWMPKYAVENDEQIKKFSQNIGTAWAPQGTSILYNTMIHPLAPYRIAGVLWYQGETNSLVVQEAKIYGKMLKGLIQSWRKVFENDFSFYYVQIAPFDGYYPQNGAAYLREQQETALGLPKTGMVTVGDLVDSVKNIHPRLKAAVGIRLANLALKEQYNFSKLEPYSPRFSKMKINKQSVTITLSTIGKLSCNQKKIKSFQVAGKEKIFYPADATFDKTGGIILVSKKVINPIAVRYCFTNDGMPNLFDTNGLPLMPFRTDKW